MKKRRAYGSGGLHKAGYIQRYVDGKLKLEHVIVAEAALGKPLPAGAQVHHLDGDPANNAPSNLVICPDQSYHRLLHVRQRALDACGNATWRKCLFCKRHDDPSNLVRLSPTNQCHSSCRATYDRARRHPATSKENLLSTH